jgi:hypothetical protein
MQLHELGSLHYLETIYVLGSGPSLNFVDKSFFDDFFVISTNFSARAIGVKAHYAFTHYHQNALDLTKDTGVVVTLARDTVTQNPWPGEQPDNLVLVEQDNYKPPGSSWNPLTTHPPKPYSLAYGSSSLHGAMHLAAWMGAKNIVLVGADCGQIDGADRVSNYQVQGGDTLWSLYNNHHKFMKDWLVKEYGANVYSLNPFINFNLEGHTFRGV